MLRIDRQSRALRHLEPTRLSIAGMLERRDLQQMLRSSPEAFCRELGEELLLIGEEVRASDFVDDRIDLLAIDRDGFCVVIELKRGAHKLQLLQALAYAALISKWAPADFAAKRAEFTSKRPDEAEEEIEEFLLEDPASLNAVQRVILMAEQYDYEVLATAEWLAERHKVPISCYRLELAVDGQAEYLSCSCVYPPAELSDQARKIRSDPKPTKWQDWDDALRRVKNDAVTRFYREELERGRPNRLRRRMLLYDINGRRRYWMSARARHAYTWQRGRFAGDVDFWREHLGDDVVLSPVAEGRALRLFLKTDAHFRGFLEAFNAEIPGKEFQHEPVETDDESEEQDEAGEAA